MFMLAGVELVDDTGAHISTRFTRTERTNCATVVFATVHTLPHAPISVVALTEVEVNVADAANRNL